MQFSSEDKLIVSMDNMKGGVEEVREIQKMLERTIQRHFKKLKIPGVWLLFSQSLRKLDKKIISLENCFKLSSRFDMSEKETKLALWFLHHHAGILMYFSNVPLLHNLVILDTQVMYDSVTFLILRATNFDSVGQAPAENFRETGQFVLKDLVVANDLNVSGDLIPPKMLVALLEFLHIIVPIAPIQKSVSYEEKEVIYLMPCVLHIAKKDDLDAICNDQSRPQNIAPLILRYKCGFVPLGIFPALVARLIGSQFFQLIRKGMKKNTVKFLYGPLKILVTFLCYSKFCVILVSQLPPVELNIAEECIALRKTLADELEKVSSHMNYGFSLDYQFAFECPLHPGREHLCSDQSEAYKVMSCLQTGKPVTMKSMHKVWFADEVRYVYIPCAM